MNSKESEQPDSSANSNLNESEQSETSCDPAMTRRQFVAKVRKRAAMTGLLLAPMIVDSFLARPLAARASETAATKDAIVTFDTGIYEL